jgi:hypothetical protein
MRVPALSQMFSQTEQEPMADYVAHLQIHMALQARNLVPALNPSVVSQGGKGAIDHRSLLLQQTQAEFEKVISRR